jgi:hypothetical protein
MTVEIDSVREENIRLRIENESLRQELERCRELARETRLMLAEYWELGRLIELLNLTQRPAGRTVGNGCGRSAARRY